MSQPARIAAEDYMEALADRWLLVNLPAPPFQRIVAAHDGHGERMDKPADRPAAPLRAAAAFRAGQQALVNVVRRTAA